MICDLRRRSLRANTRNATDISTNNAAADYRDFEAHLFCIFALPPHANAC